MAVQKNLHCNLRNNFCCASCLLTFVYRFLDSHIVVFALVEYILVEQAVNEWLEHLVSSRVAWV
jgi:hypothetical protein